MIVGYNNCQSHDLLRRTLINLVDRILAGHPYLHHFGQVSRRKTSLFSILGVFEVPLQTDVCRLQNVQADRRLI